MSLLMKITGVHSGLILIAMIGFTDLPSGWFQDIVVPAIPVRLTQLEFAQIDSPSTKKAEAIQLYQKGSEQLKQGQSQAAIATFQQVLDLVRDLRERMGEAGALNQIALAYSNLGQYHKALEFYQQALQIYREENTLREQGVILTNIGQVYQNLGQYTKALESHEQALKIALNVGDQKRQGSILNNIGAVYQNLGRYQNALSFYQQALEIRNLEQDQRGQGVTLNNIGLVYDNLGQNQKALTAYQQALDLFQKRGDRIGEGRVLTNLGLIYSNLGDYQKALDCLQTALNIRREVLDRPGEGTTLDNLGTVYRLMGNSQIALNYYQQALKIAQEVNAPAEAGGTLNNMGLTFLQINQPDAATQTLLQAVELWESLRPGLTDENKVSLLERQAETYQTLQKALINQNKIEQALEVAERGRTRAFVELLAARLQGNQGISLEESTSPTVKKIQQIARLHQATLVEYSIVDSYLYIWVIQPNGKLHFRTVNTDILAEGLLNFTEKTRVATALGFSRGNPTPNWVFDPRASEPPIPNASNTVQVKPDSRRINRNLQKSYQLLIEPITDLLPKDANSPIVFIPQGGLFLIPFAALQNPQGRYFIEDHTLSISPSIQILELTHLYKTRQHPSHLHPLIVGNPTMPSIALEPEDEPEPLTSLPGSEKEALAIAHLLGTQSLIGDKATETEVVQKMPQANIIHLATHGLLNELKHLGLSVPGALALTPTSFEDGLLTSEEILNLKLNAELVVLSACNTGRGTITADGVIGLSRAFMAAGVQSVIVSLWYIPDAPSADLMVEFYRQRLQGANKATALRQAMLKTLQNHPKESDWAAFILIGQFED